MTEPENPNDLLDEMARHEPLPVSEDAGHYETQCSWCSEEWPCDVAKLVGEVGILRRVLREEQADGKQKDEALEQFRDALAGSKKFYFDLIDQVQGMLQVADALLHHIYRQEVPADVADWALKLDEDALEALRKTVRRAHGEK